VAEARELLTEDQFDRAREEGRAMNIDKALTAKVCPPVRETFLVAPVDARA